MPPRLQRLLGDLLTTSRLQAATLDLDLVERDLSEVLAPALQRLRVAHPDAVIESELGDGVRAVVDADRLAQIVDNLVANAVAYGRSPIHVSTRAGRRRGRARRCATPVPASRPSCATGCSSGSPPGRPRHRAGAAHRPRAGPALGGEATYLPEQNAFVVRLPRAADQAVTVRVLLVDDVADVRRLVRIALRYHGGFEVVAEAGAGLQAIELATQLQPDIVLLDLGLPDLAGRDVLTRVREVVPGAKVVVFTGADNDDRAYYEEHTAGYVRKSGDLDYLVELLDDVGRTAHRERVRPVRGGREHRAAGPRVRAPMAARERCRPRPRRGLPDRHRAGDERGAARGLAVRGPAQPEPTAWSASRSPTTTPGRRSRSRSAPWPRAGAGSSSSRRSPPPGVSTPSPTARSPGPSSGRSELNGSTCLEHHRDRAVVDRLHLHVGAEHPALDVRAEPLELGAHGLVERLGSPGPGAAACQVGRRPLRASPYSVNWLTTRIGAPTSEADCSSRSSRSSQSLRASHATSAGPSAWVTPT